MVQRYRDMGQMSVAGALVNGSLAQALPVSPDLCTLIDCPSDCIAECGWLRSPYDGNNGQCRAGRITASVSLMLEIRIGATTLCPVITHPPTPVPTAAPVTPAPTPAPTGTPTPSPSTVAPTAPLATSTAAPSLLTSAPSVATPSPTYAAVVLTEPPTMAETEVQSSQGGSSNGFVDAVGGETQLVIGACVLVLFLALVAMVAVRLRSKRRQQIAQVVSPDGPQEQRFTPIAGRLDADLTNLYGPSISQLGSYGPPPGSPGGSSFGVVLPSTSANWMGDGLQPLGHSIYGEPAAFGMPMPGNGMPVASMQGFGSMPGIPGVGVGGRQWAPGAALAAVGRTTLIQDVYKWQPDEPQTATARLEQSHAIHGANDVHFEA